jgi:hypothetical protein
MDSFWGQAFEVAIRGKYADQQTDAPGDPVAALQPQARKALTGLHLLVHDGHPGFLGLPN